MTATIDICFISIHHAIITRFDCWVGCRYSSWRKSGCKRWCIYMHALVILVWITTALRAVIILQATAEKSDGTSFIANSASTCMRTRVTSVITGVCSVAYPSRTDTTCAICPKSTCVPYPTSGAIDPTTVNISLHEVQQSIPARCFGGRRCRGRGRHGCWRPSGCTCAQLAGNTFLSIP